MTYGFRSCRDKTTGYVTGDALSTTVLTTTPRGKRGAKSRLLQQRARGFVARQKLPEYLNTPEVEALIRLALNPQARLLLPSVPAPNRWRLQN